MGVDPLRIALVGATGAVGREALALLAERGHPARHVLALASERSAGIQLDYGTQRIAVEAFTPQRLRGRDAALLCTSAERAREIAPVAREQGLFVVDNSSAFRDAPDVPLVLPEVNGELLRAHPDARLVANPNCSTILLLLALDPIRRAFGLERVLVSTYQAVSGAGLAAMDELRSETRAALDGAAASPTVFPVTCAFNVFTHESPVDPDTGWCTEEEKIVRESARIWSERPIPVFPTCVRVPVLRAHSQSIVCDLERPGTEAQVRETLARAPGLRVVDDRGRGVFPTPLAASGVDDVLVGRVRGDPSDPERRFALWLSGDQLRKGAALNALQIVALRYPGLRRQDA